MRTVVCLLVLTCAVPFIALSQLSPSKSDSNLIRKASPSVLKNRTGNWMLAVDNIHQFKKEFPATVILRELPFANVIVVQVSSISQSQQLLASPRVLFADQANRHSKEELIVSGFDRGANRINTVHNRYPALTGEGLIVSVKENMFDTTDIDFKGRVVTSGFASANVSGHANIMATMIAGAGNSFYEGTGVTWKANLQSVTFANLLPEPETYYRNQRINVQNHSYGTGLENYYGADAVAYDALVQNNPTLLHVFSSGNSGTAISMGPYAGIAAFANLTGSFKMAKNIITVGATDSVGNVEIASSRGPAYDGRIKPELVAFGQDGSSGAAAIVSGISLLMQQAYMRLHHDSLPPAALIKAILINTAEDAGNKGPDYAAGFGMANAFRAVNSIHQSHFAGDDITQSATKNFDLTVQSNIRSLKVTLVWTDAPAIANATKALVNDIDLELVHVQSGKIWKPWVLSSFPRRDSLQLPAVRGRDSLNNAEQVTIDDPPAGNYIIRVTGHRVTGASQSFFITYQADTANQYQWMYPMSSDPMQSGWSNMMRWESSFAPGTTGQLAYSTDNGNNWQTIAANANLDAKYFRWNSPAVFSKAILRMTIGGTHYYSDTFALSNPIATSVGFICDSVMFYWDRPAGADSFRVYHLLNKFLEPVAVTSDTFYVSAKNVTVRHFSIAPIIDGKEGIRSITFDYTTQGVGCYFKSFLAYLVNGQSQLQVKLGTLRGVREVQVIKLTKEGFVPIQTLSSAPAGLQFVLTDPAPTQGVNVYHIALILDNGQVVYSAREVVYYLETAPYVIYPNPAPAGSVFRILQKEVGIVRVVVYDVMGRIIKDEVRDELVIAVSTANMQKGVYVVSVWKGGKKEFTEKLIVQ